MMLIVSLGLIPLGLYTGYLGWMAFEEPQTFRQAPLLPEAGGDAGRFYKTSGDAAGEFLAPPLYPEVAGALQYQVSRERKDDAGEGWTQTGIVQAERVSSIRLGSTAIAVTHATRILGKNEEALRPAGDNERLRITWTPAAGTRMVAYGIFDGSALGEGRFQRVFLASPAGERELLDSLEETGWIKALVLGLVGLVALVMAGFAVRSALR